MCDQAAIVPRFTLSLPVDAYTQWKKVGSLLSSCWHLRKTMPIHSLGIEALSGLDQSLFVSFGRGYPLSAFHYSEKRECFCRDVDHIVSLDDWQQTKSKHVFWMTDPASQKHTLEIQKKKEREKASKHVSFIVTVAFWFCICEPGQNTGSQCVSLCWQGVCEPPGNKNPKN